MELVDGKLVRQHRAEVEAAEDHLGHLVPGLEHLAAVDALDGDALEDDLVPIDAGVRGQDAEQGDMAAVKHVVEHVVEGPGIARHLQADVEAFADVLRLHGGGERAALYIDDVGGAHLGGEVEAVVVDVGDDDVAGAEIAADAGGDDADGAGAGDQHVLADDVERQRAVGGVAVGIEEGGDLRGDLRRDQPQVLRGHADVFGEGAVAVDADAAGMGAEMAAAGAAVAALAAGEVAFGRDTVADLVVVDARTHFDDAADELVADDKAGRDRALGPFIPLIDVEVGAADGGLLDLDEHLVHAGRRRRHALHPDALLGPALHQGLHGRHRRLAPLSGSFGRATLAHGGWR
jgi:hypothetical protein